MVTMGTTFAELASSGMAQLNHQMAIAGTKAGFVTYRTASGDSLGSLGSYSKDWNLDRKSTRLNSSHSGESRMPSSA